MSETSWRTVRRTSVRLSVAASLGLAAGAFAARLLAPAAAPVLAGAALSPLLALVSALAMRGAEPLAAGRFLLRLVLAQGAGGVLAAAAAVLLHALGVPWGPLLLGFAGALFLQAFLQPWWLLRRARPSSSCSATP